VRWLERLSPWPEEFGLGRIRALLAGLGDPQLAYPSIHVVGTNGKTTTTRMTAAILAAQGVHVGAYTSPHVTNWSERIRVGGEEVELERALDRVRTAGDDVGATQFEVLTAAALAAFAEAGVEAAVVEAGLGGRFDATNVLSSPVQVLTNIALEHTDVLGETREAIAREKLAVVRPGADVVLGEAEWESLARDCGAARVTIEPGSNAALARAAAEAFLGRAVDPSPATDLRLPGRLERRSESPLEIWDGAHNLAGLGYLRDRLPDRSYVLVVSILEDKDVEAMLAALRPLGETLVSTASSNERAVPSEQLAALAGSRFPRVEAVPDPAAALVRGRVLAGPGGALLVTGSLYLLADLNTRGGPSGHSATYDAAAR
jgi:dihydrofolate synthase/folylpolyglutamate synthase